jgi:glycosyltransferase involved in cell wall biosynthesis
MVEISVIVCTYNRAGMLARVLESLDHQTLDRARYEVIVVDNNSTDQTRQVVEALRWRERQRYCVETRQGLAYARNRGVGEAAGDYVAFIDDDAEAKTDWLERALDCLTSPSRPLAVGGPVLPLYDAPKPEWFKDEYETRWKGDRPRHLIPGESLSGSNMFFRRDIVGRCGGFDVRVGVSGDALSVGEETGLFARLWLEFPDALIYYSPAIVVRHSVPSFKMHVSYLLKRAFVSGQVWSIQYGPSSCGGRLRTLFGIVWSMIRKSATALASGRHHRVGRQWLAESVAPVVIDFGRLVGCMGLTWRMKQRS